MTAFSRSILVAVLLGLMFAGTAGAFMEVPRGQYVYGPHTAEAWPVNHWLPGEAWPLGVGPIAEAGNSFVFRLGFVGFLGAVDIYVGILAPALVPDTLLLLLPDGSLIPFTGNLLPWRANSHVPVVATVYSPIPAEVLPFGTYTVYILVTPAEGTAGSGLGTSGKVTAKQSLADYYLWIEQFTISALQTAGPLQTCTNWFDPAGTSHPENCEPGDNVCAALGTGPVYQVGCEGPDTRVVCGTPCEYTGVTCGDNFGWASAMHLNPDRSACLETVPGCSWRWVNAANTAGGTVAIRDFCPGTVNRLRRCDQVITDPSREFFTPDASYINFNVGPCDDPRPGYTVWSAVECCNENVEPLQTCTFWFESSGAAHPENCGAVDNVCAAMGTGPLYQIGCEGGDSRVVCGTPCSYTGVKCGSNFGWTSFVSENPDRSACNDTLPTTEPLQTCTFWFEPSGAAHPENCGVDVNVCSAMGTGPLYQIGCEGGDSRVVCGTPCGYTSVTCGTNFGWASAMSETPDRSACTGP